MVQVQIRWIQHYLYCPHRFGLIENDCSFEENIFVARGNQSHERIINVDEYVSRNVVHKNSVNVYNDEWNLYGITDCLEFRKDEDGVYIEELGGRNKISIVEYKVKSPKKNEYHYEDFMQVLAQKICIDRLFNTDCKTFIYYVDTKKRIELSFTNDDYIKLKKLIAEIQTCIELGSIPSIKKGQYCSGCSMSNICMPIKRS